jgi:hypothetical protein
LIKFVDPSRYHSMKATGKLPSPKGVAFSIIKLLQKDDFRVSDLVQLVQSDPADCRSPAQVCQRRGFRAGAADRLAAAGDRRPRVVPGSRPGHRPVGDAQPHQRTMPGL